MAGRSCLLVQHCNQHIMMGITLQRVGMLCKGGKFVIDCLHTRLHCAARKRHQAPDQFMKPTAHQPRPCDEIFIEHGQTPLFEGAMMDRV
jgi:hypothetical protein